MPVQTINFANLPTEGDPMMAAILPAIQQGIQLKYMKPMMQNELQRQQLANALSQVQLDYADPMAQSDLSYNQARTPNLQSQTRGQDLANALSQVTLDYAPQMSQADLDLKRIEIPYKKQKTELMPAETLAKLLGGAGRYNQASWQSSPNSQLLRVLNNPQMQNLISNNPQVGESVTRTLGNIGVGSGESGSSGKVSITNDMISSLFGFNSSGNQGGQQNTNPKISPMMASQMSLMNNPAAMQPQQMSLMNNQSAMQPQQQMPQQQQFSPSEQDVTSLMQAAGDSFLKKTKTGAQLNQGTYAAALEGFFQAGDELMPSVVKYAGLLGKAKGAKDKALSQFQQNDPDYENYWNFTHDVAPNLANDMRRTLGGQATDYEGKIMANLANPDYWDSNPQLAMSQWNYLRKIYQEKINPVIYGSNSEINKRMRAPMGGQIGGQPTPEQIKQLTISPDQAKKLSQAGLGKPGQAQGMFASSKNMPTQEDLAYTAKESGVSEDVVIAKIAKKYGISEAQVRNNIGIS